MSPSEQQPHLGDAPSQDAQLRALLDQGISAAKRGRHERARRFFEEALALDGANEEAWLWLAAMSEDRGLARAICERVLEAHPDSTRARSALRWLDQSEQASASVVATPPDWAPIKAEEVEALPAEPEPVEPEYGQEALAPEPPFGPEDGPALFVPPWEIDAVIPIMPASTVASLVAPTEPQPSPVALSHDAEPGAGAEREAPVAEADLLPASLAETPAPAPATLIEEPIAITMSSEGNPVVPVPEPPEGPTSVPQEQAAPETRPPEALPESQPLPSAMPAELAQEAATPKSPSAEDIVPQEADLAAPRGVSAAEVGAEEATTPEVAVETDGLSVGAGRHTVRNVAMFAMLGIALLGAILLVFLASSEAKADRVRVALGVLTSTPTLTPTPTNTLTPTPTWTPIPTLTLTASPTSAPSVTPTASLSPTPSWITAKYLPLPTTGKWIEVDLSEQRLIAYEGTEVVFRARVSTGRSRTPTVLGKFRIQRKFASQLMTGPGYYLPGVPWVMYFFGNYALHGAYWHNNWGTPMSHGCVNMRREDAKWLYDWTDPPVPAGQGSLAATRDNPGTWVIIHE